MGEWSNLTQREKSNIIRFAIKNGVSDINQIRDTFNVYAKDSLANVDYNMAAAKASGFGSNGNGHYPDTFKRPNHPTFSDESIYHSEATPGGHWSERNGLQRWNFSPSAQQISEPGYIQKAIDYLNNSESEGVTLTDNQGRYPSINGTIYGGVLPEVVVTPQYKEGGSIHIKHPGRLTALKERTGKTEAELWATGNAHTRKMITFARNARKWKHSTGGPLYPFSFQKNPYWKTPVVRYDEGGILGHQYGLGDFLRSLFNRNSEPQVEEVFQTPAPLDYSELRIRQAYAESRFNNNAKSGAGAVGMFQIMPSTLADYNKANGTSYTTKDLSDQSINTAVRDWYIDKLSGRPWVTKGGASDSVQFGKVLAGYNYGGQNTLDALNKAKADGVDIYNSWDWLSYMPKETQDYINFILRNQDNSVLRNNSAYKAASLLNKDKVELLK